MTALIRAHACIAHQAAKIVSLRLLLASYRLQLHNQKKLMADIQASLDKTTSNLNTATANVQAQKAEIAQLKLDAITPAQVDQINSNAALSDSLVAASAAEPVQ